MVKETTEEEGGGYSFLYRFWYENIYASCVKNVTANRQGVNDKERVLFQFGSRFQFCSSLQEFLAQTFIVFNL